MKNSAYFDIVETLPDEEAGRRALAQGRVQFVLNIPAGFLAASCCAASVRRCWSKPTPPIPTATSTAVAALPSLVQPVADKDLTGPLAHLNGGPAAFDVQVHSLYNPEGITQYNIVPGLMGVILTMTLVMMTGLAITRERERGTMENLLATPVLPLEVMTRQDRALRRHRPHAGDDHSCARRLRLPCAVRRQRRSPSISRRCCSSRPT